MTLQFLVTVLFFLPQILACPDGAIEAFDGSCYMTFNGPSNWFESEYHCTRPQGNLVAIRNTFDNTYLNGIANEEFPIGTEDYWIGGSTAYNNGWQWVDGSDMNYTFWDSKQPINTNGSFCMVQQLRNGRWAQADCNLTKPYLCKVPIELGPRCPSGWAYNDITKKCYFLYTQQVKWNDSLEYCQTFNGSLVSIHSDLENMITETVAFSFLTTNQTFAYWIGLYTNVTGSWIWADGTPQNYTYWQSGPGFNSNFAYAQVGPNSIDGWLSYTKNVAYGLCQSTANVV